MNFSGRPRRKPAGRHLRDLDGVIRHLITKMDERIAARSIADAKAAAEAKCGGSWGEGNRGSSSRGCGGSRTGRCGGAGCGGAASCGGAACSAG